MADRGRPKKAKSDKREKQLHVLLTIAEHKAVAEAAKAESLGASSWARSVILSAAKDRAGKANR